MKRLFVLLAGLLSASFIVARAQTPPTLAIQAVAPQMLRIGWPNTALGFGLESSSSPTASSPWQPVIQTPTDQNNQFSVLMNVGQGNQFFRLRLPPFTTIREISPVDGETGVAVIRETIVHLTAPLASNAVVTTDNFYAGYGGRKLLSRVELSTDRRKVTLFYLEPLPGSTRINAIFNGTGLIDELGRPLDPDGDGVAGGLAVIAFDTLNVTPLTGTAVVGTVFSSELIPGPDTGTNAINRPLEGVIITVDGMEETLRTTTDAQGKFTLAPAPPGRFFVKIDGRMANGSQWPKNGAYYPYVGKAWDAVAGKTNNLAGGTGQIFLPLISADTLQPVSMTVDTTISFPPSVISNNPALAGVSITIPANSLFSDDGTRGGKVGIAPVPPDRLPGPLPPGLQPPIIITVQTDGPLNFDKPAPVCFPNLPDTTTGKPWPPGTQGGLISFNHKKGVWEPVGGMTVSADGKYFCTDPGVGIIQPGWHGVGCPKPDGPGPDPDPYPDEPCKPDPNEVEQCFKGCDAEYRRCRIVGNIDKRREISDCFIAASTADERRACANKLWANGNDEETRCKEERTACEEPCRTCSASKFSLRREATEGTRLKSAALSTLDRVLGLVEEAFDLLRPDLAARNDPPDSVLQQVKAKLALADEIAGGNAEALMIEAAASVERELDSFHTGAGRSAEEFPGYPVLFAAEIERKGSTFWIRGKTEPFGRYWLYVPPDGQLRSIRFYDPSTRRHDRVFPNSDPFARYALPNFRLRSLDSGVLDSDSDGLPDGVEYVYGTDPIKADTDGDGIPDGAEVQQGTDPLGGLIVQTGVIATVKTPSSAVDVAAEGGLIVTAEGNSGISIFSKYNGDNPTILAHVVTHGPAQRVAFGDKLIAVAEGDSGLEIIDITDPATARITRQVPLPFESSVSAVAVVGRIAYVGLGAGTVVAVDVTTGRQLKHLSLSEEVVDLVIADDYLYALTRGQIYVVSIRGGDLTLAGTAASPSPAGPNRRLFVGGGIGYALDRNGYNTLNLTDPANPALIHIGTSGQFGWRQMVVNGSGLALAAVGPNSTDDGPHDVSLYDTGSPTNAVTVITTFPTPGIAQTVAIWEGLAYVADDTAGLQVINYLPYDSQGVAPKITLSANFPLAPARVVEGAGARITANTTDDVQVRNVELYIDGELVQTDGSFPFEFRFVVPQLAVGKSSFSVRAKATDTGGNSTWSDQISVNLLPDTTPPQVTRILPHSIAAGAKSVSVSFDEEINPASLTASALKLFASGPDGVIGSSDDVELTGGTRTVQSDRSGATLSFGSNFRLGTYRIVVGRDFTDRRGNHLSAEVTQDFRVVDAVYWINPAGGDWSDPQNWSTGRLPEPTDDVLISTPDPATITYSKGNSSIQTLFGENSFVLSGGRLEITQTIQVSRFDLNGGTLARAHILGSDTEGADLHLKSGTLDSVTLDADAIMGNQSFFTVVNGLTINRTLTLDGHQNYAQLRFQGAQTLGGTGQLVFGGTANANYLVPNAALTIASSFTIHGASGFVGQAGAGADVPVINQGTISADVAGVAIAIHGNPFTNMGTVEAKNGGLVAIGSAWNNAGIFKITDGTFNLGGSFSTAGIGTIQRNGGTINLLGLLNNTNAIFALNPAIGSWVLAGGTIRSGSITSAGGASLRLRFGILDGVTLDSDLTMENQDNVFVVNGLTINRALTMEGHPNFAQLSFQGAQTLGGAGQLVFGGTDGINYLSPNAALTIGSGFTIRGASGIVRDSAVPVINQGTISADVAGGTITIHGNPFTNTGTVEAKNGGLVTLDSPWNNTGVFKITDSTFNLGGRFTTAGIGTIERSGGVVNLVGLLDNTNATFALNPTLGSWVLAGGTIQGGSITSAGGASLRLKLGTLDGVTLDSDLTMENQDNVIVRNGLTINRTLTMEGHPNFAQLSFQGAQTLGGSGQLVFGGTNSVNYLSPDAALTIGPGFTIHGASGIVRDSAVPVINQGTISADVAGGTITIHGSSFNNTGTVEAKNGGLLDIGSAWNNGGIFRIADGTFNLGGSFTTAGIGTIERSGGTVNLVGLLDNTNAIFALNPAIGSWVLAGGTIRSGSIATTGGAALRLKSGTLDGVTLDSDLIMENKDDVIVLNGLTINRTLTMEGHPNFAQLAFQGAQTLGGVGQLIFGSTNSLNYLSKNSALTIGSGFTIHGASGFVGQIVPVAPLINQGTISADVAGGTIIIHGDPFTNNGTTNELNGGRLLINP